MTANKWYHKLRGYVGNDHDHNLTSPTLACTLIDYPQNTHAKGMHVTNMVACFKQKQFPLDDIAYCIHDSSMKGLPGPACMGETGMCNNNRMCYLNDVRCAYMQNRHMSMDNALL